MPTPFHPASCSRFIPFPTFPSSSPPEPVPPPFLKRGPPPPAVTPHPARLAERPRTSPEQPQAAAAPYPKARPVPGPARPAHTLPARGLANTRRAESPAHVSLPLPGTSESPAGCRVRNQLAVNLSQSESGAGGCSLAPRNGAKGRSLGHGLATDQVPAMCPPPVY